MEPIMITIGIDNGTTGSIGVVGTGFADYWPMPTKRVKHYTKRDAWFNRVDWNALRHLLEGYEPNEHSGVVYIERPFTSVLPMMIKTVMVAQRSYEATTIVMEMLGLEFKTIDSKEWQKGVGIIEKGKELKVASELIGISFYPDLTTQIKSQGDADGLLIAHYYHEKNQNT
jgi:hypothetical protein